MLTQIVHFWLRWMIELLCSHSHQHIVIDFRDTCLIEYETLADIYLCAIVTKV